MGNSVSSYDPRHVRIWQNLANLQSNDARINMLETLMVGPEYIQVAKKAGVYAHILQWMASVRRGERVQWPWQQAAAVPQHQQTTPVSTYPYRQAVEVASRTPFGDAQVASRTPFGDAQVSCGARDVRIPAMTEPRKIVKETTLATVAPPKRALDTLHESYRILGLDDTKPLSHEGLKQAYKRAAAKAHPDRGGSSEEFDQVTRAFLYVEEVLNKLIPKGSGAAVSSEDPRLKQPVTHEAAMKARDIPLSKWAAEEVVRKPVIEDKPAITLNPKKLNMTVFNQLFEENRLPDPDQDGYGDWLRSNEPEKSRQSDAALRSKFNADVFNRTFMSEAQRSAAADAGNLFKSPEAMVHTGGAAELGGGRPNHYISAMGARTAYTDLKYAYGEGSTFSHEVANARTESGMTFDQLKRERESAPVPLTSDELSAVTSMDRQREMAEEERRRRLAVHDVEAESVYSKLQRRLMIQ